MTEVLDMLIKGSFILSSIYDGQEYYTKDYTREEAELAEKNKRQNLIDNGYDVETYEKKYHELIQKREEDSIKGKDIWEREKIFLAYNRKIKELAKEYLDIDFQIIT